MWEQGLDDAIASEDVLKTLLILRDATNVDYVRREGDINALMMCAKYGIDIAVELLIAKGADVNSEQSFGVTALHYACANGNTESAKLLISSGAEVNKADSDGESALYAAIENGQLSCVDLLIKHGGSIHDKNFYLGQSALDCAIYHEQNGIVSNLILHGANVNIQNYTGAPPLYVAVHEDNREGAEMLLKAGADPFLKNTHGESPAQYAHKKKRTEILDLMQKYGHAVGLWHVV